MKTRGERGRTSCVLARATAQILLKINAIRYDVVADQPFRLDVPDLSAHRHESARLIEIIADVLYAVDPDDVAPTGAEDSDLTRRIAARLHLPKTNAEGSRILPLSWRASMLGTSPGFAVFDDRWTRADPGDTPAVMALTTWQDVLDVLHIDPDRQQASLRFALATHLKTQKEIGLAS